MEDAVTVPLKVGGTVYMGQQALKETDMESLLGVAACKPLERVQRSSDHLQALVSWRCKLRARIGGNIPPTLRARPRSAASGFVEFCFCGTVLEPGTPIGEENVSHIRVFYERVKR